MQIRKEKVWSFFCCSIFWWVTTVDYFFFSAFPLAICCGFSFFFIFIFLVLVQEVAVFLILQTEKSLKRLLDQLAVGCRCCMKGETKAKGDELLLSVYCIFFGCRCCCCGFCCCCWLRITNWFLRLCSRKVKICDVLLKLICCLC